MVDRVTPVQKQEARDLIRLAKRRGFRLSLTKDQLNDPKCVGGFLAKYGNRPPDFLFRKVAGIAKYLKVKLTVEQAMNKWHCTKFLGESRAKVPGGIPSEAQIELAEQLADYHEINVPDAVRVSLDDWHAFFQRYLGREERDILEEMERELAKYVDTESYGSMVYHLNRSKRIFSNRDSLNEAKLDSARELLIKGEDPFSLAQDLNIPEQAVFNVVKELEAQGHELVY